MEVLLNDELLCTVLDEGGVADPDLVGAGLRDPHKQLKSPILK